MMPDQVQYYFQLAQNQAQQQQTTTQSSNTAVAAAATATTGVTTAQPGQQILVQTPGGGQVCEHVISVQVMRVLDKTGAAPG